MAPPWAPTWKSPPCCAASGLPGLHVRGNGAALSQTLKAFVGVVQEHPVLGLEVRLGRAGCSDTEKSYSTTARGRYTQAFDLSRSLRVGVRLRPTWLKDVGLWEVIKVGRVVYALDLDGDGRGSFPGGGRRFLLTLAPLKPSDSMFP